VAARRRRYFWVLDPGEAGVLLPETLLARAEVRTAWLMQPADHVHGLLGQGGQTHIIAEGAVRHEDVVPAQVTPQAAKEADIVPVKALQNFVNNGAIGEGKQRQYLHDRKAATGLLVRRLRIPPLVFRGIGQLSRG